jgi:hypothetical protein
VKDQSSRRLGEVSVKESEFPEDVSYSSDSSSEDRKENAFRKKTTSVKDDQPSNPPVPLNRRY